MHCFTIPIRFWALPLISSCFLIGSRSLELSNWWGWWCVGRRLSSWPLRTRFGDNINGRAAHWKHIRQRLSDNSFVVVICQTSSVGLTAVIVRTNRNEKNKQQTVIKISLQFSQHFLRRCIVLLSTRCFGHCTGCLLNSASTTSWPCWRSILSRRHTRSIWTSTSRCAQAHATLDRRPSHCCACHFDGHHSSDDRSALPHLWFGAHFYVKLRLSLLSNPGWKLTCFILLSVTTLPVPPAPL